MNFLIVAIREISQDRFAGNLPLFLSRDSSRSDKSFDPAHDGLRVTRSGVILSLSKDKKRIKFISLEINDFIT